MWTLVERFFSLNRPTEAIEIEADSPTTLTVRHGRTLTAFDRLSRAVTQRGRLVATFGAIHCVRVQQQPLKEGPVAWSVSLELSGSRMVPLGRSTDEAAASTAAARIGSITGARVIS